VLKALVEVGEADGAQDRAHQSKEEASGGNASKEGPSQERPAERVGFEQAAPAAHHCRGYEDEDAHEDFAFLADGGPAKVHPRNHQLRMRSVEGYLPANDCTYKAHHDPKDLVQDGACG